MQESGFAQLIARHGLSGLAVGAIERGSLKVEEEAESLILSKFGSERRKSAVLSLECNRIGALASKAIGQLIPPIVLKGYSAARHYGDPSVRNFTDLDLLVPQAQAAVWGNVLRQLGYSPPNSWTERTARSYKDSVDYVRHSAGGRISCELHIRLLRHKKTMAVGYESFIPYAKPGEVAGVLELDSGAHLVAMSLHMAHHRPSDRRLIWFRDFIEMADSSSVVHARTVAENLQISFIFEWALAEVDRVLSGALGRKGVIVGPGMSFAGPYGHLDLMRELGPLKSACYLVSRLDLRRFLTEQGRFDWQEAGNWVRRQFLLGRCILLGRRRGPRRPTL